MQVNIPERLKKVIPRWTQKIQQRETFGELNQECEVDGKRLDIGEFSCCIVGETHQMFDQSDLSDYSYGCSICGNYCMTFFRIIDRGEDNPDAIEELEDTLKDFDVHIAIEHSNLFEKEAM